MHKLGGFKVQGKDSEAAREMPWFAQEIFVRAQRRGPLSDKKYRDARATCGGVDAVGLVHVGHPAHALEDSFSAS